MKRLQVVLACIVLTAAYIVAAAPPAAAATCTMQSHCYSLAEFGYAGSKFNGDEMNLYVHCMTTTNPSSDFVDYETWAVMGTYWTETGITIGAGTPNPNQLYFFFADSRPGGGYHEHYYTVSHPQLSTFYYASIEYDSSAQDYAIEIGPYLAYSGLGGSQAYPITDLQTGTERTEDNSIVRGLSDNLTWIGQYGGVHAGWQYNSHTASLSTIPSGQGIAQWTTLYNDVRLGTETPCEV